ncbi:MAG: CHAT domain-containing protein, partial [Planctomycetes bacterium]|nr:CHAT domain-containing protein [Planctomycetota bacterium]
LDLLDELAYGLNLHGEYRDVSAVAAHLVALYREFAAVHPGFVWPAASCRNEADTGLLANTLDAVAAAVARGRAALADGEAFERALLGVDGVRLHCRLGRLEAASDDLADALAALDAFGRDIAAADAATQEQFGPFLSSCRYNVCLAAADLSLLDGRYDRALEQLEALPDSGRFHFYRLLIGTAQGERTAEDELEQLVRAGAFPDRLTLAALPKLIHAALARGEAGLAAERFALWREDLGTGVATFDDAGKRASLAIELALRGQLPVDTRLRDAGERAFHDLLAAWRHAPALAGGVGFLQLDNRATLVADLVRLEQRLDPAHGNERALRHVLAAHAASAGLRRVPRPEELAGLIRADDHGLLLLVPGTYVTPMFWLQGGRTLYTEARDVGVLRDAASALHASAIDFRSGSPATRAALYASAEAAADVLLPAAVASWLQSGRRLTVSGAGMVENAPFDLMRIDVGGTRRWLGTLTAIDYVANLARAVTAAPRRTEGDVLIAASIATSRNGRVPHDVLASDLAPLAAPWQRPDPAPTIWRNAEVTRRRLRAALPAAAVLHLIGHGEVDWRRGIENGIVFGDHPEEGALWGEDIAGLRLDGLVAILGACDAGTTPWRRGGDPLAPSLAGALLQAGARCVVVPTSEVLYGRHLQAAATLHQQLASGEAPAIALLAARLAVADEVTLVELLLVEVHGRGFD